jgi:hypothetical protein
MMKALYNSGMVDDLGKALQIKSQDELIGKNGNFISRLSHRRRSNKTSISTDSDNDLFFDAGDGTSKVQTKINFVNEFNQLNEDFSKQINVPKVVGRKTINNHVIKKFFYYFSLLPIFRV